MSELVATNTALAAADDGLRIMIYDETDVRTWASYATKLKDHTPDAVDNVLDHAVENLDIELGLTHSWWAGGKLFRLLRRFDHTRGFNNWPAALEWIANLEPEHSIKEIQFWGHGSPGRAWIHNRPLTASSFEHKPHRDPLMRIKTRLTEDSLIWFRTCSTFAGTRGHAFAKTWADNLGCRIAAHTHIIGLWQGGLHSIKPNENPQWPDTEGIKDGTPDKIKSMLWSRPWTPNTIFGLRSTLPKGW